ncbi:MAG: hypothetical protein U0941_10575 [Planctomycetaceae bacterium]
MMKKGIKAVVSKRAVIQRINRKLATEGQKLKTSRSVSEQSNFGEFYIIDMTSNFVVAYPVDLTDTARELGCLGGWEAVEE